MVKTQEELTQLKTECETLTAKLNELSEDALSGVSAGKSIISIMEELLPLTLEYPDVVVMMDALNKGDYGIFLMLLKKFKTAHPELSYIFEE